MTLMTLTLMTLTLMTGFNISVLKTCSKRVMHCNLLFIMYLCQYVKVVINIFMYKYNLHFLVSEWVLALLFLLSLPHSTPHPPIRFVKNTSSQRQIYVWGGAFFTLRSGGKLLPKPLILHFFFVKCNILIVFCLFSILYCVGKKYLHPWNIGVRLLCFL